MLSVDDEDDLADVFVTLAGWGYYLDSDNTLKLSPKLKLVSLQVSKGSCPKTYFVLDFSSVSISFKAARLSDGRIVNQAFFGRFSGKCRVVDLPEICSFWRFYLEFWVNS